MESLGPVIDTDAIARADGTLGVLKVDVIEEWLVDGVTLELVVSRLLTCGRCDGGGCDGCNKSGAIRISGAGVLRLTLSGSRDRRGRIVRLLRPLGDDAGLDQLRVEFRPAGAPSSFCRRVHQRALVVPSRTWLVVVLVAVVVLALVYRR